LKATTVPFTLSRFCSADEEEADDRNQPSSAPPRVDLPFARSPISSQCGAMRAAEKSR